MAELRYKKMVSLLSIMQSHEISANRGLEHNVNSDYYDCSVNVIRLHIYLSEREITRNNIRRRS